MTKTAERNNEDSAAELTYTDLNKLFKDLKLSLEGAPLASGYAFHKRLQGAFLNGDRLLAEVGDLISIDEAAYRKMSRSEKGEFNERRLALAHQEVVVPTANIGAFEQNLREALQIAKYSQRELQGGIVVQGAAGVGKSTALLNTMIRIAGEFYEQEFGADWWQRPLTSLKVRNKSPAGDSTSATAVFGLPIILNSNPNPTSISKGMLASLASSTLDPQLAEKVGKSLDEGEYTDTLVERLYTHGVKIILIDELHFVRGDKAGDHVVNFLKGLLDRTRVVLVMAGVSGTSGLELFTKSDSENPTRKQLRRRLIVLDFEPFAMYTPVKKTQAVLNGEWRDVVHLMAQRLVLLQQSPAWWRDTETLEYLWRRTQGVFTSLNTLLVKASLAAIGGSESITFDLLERIRISDDADKLAVSHRVGPLYRGRTPRLPGSANKARSAADAKGTKVAEDLIRQGYGEPQALAATDDRVD